MEVIMTQNASVKEVLPDHLARVCLMRQMECGLSCKDCGMCPARPTEELVALASNPVGAKPGDWVEVENTSGSTISLALLVYALPCVAMFLGYLLGSRLLLLSDPWCFVLAAAGLVLGFVPAVLRDRHIANRKDTPEFVILSLRAPGN